MLPRPESEGDGVPEEDEREGVHAEDVRIGDLESSLFTWRRPRVEEATREAERVETAIEILEKRRASEGV